MHSTIASCHCIVLLEQQRAQSYFSASDWLTMTIGFILSAWAILLQLLRWCFSLFELLVTLWPLHSFSGTTFRCRGELLGGAPSCLLHLTSPKRLQMWQPSGVLTAGKLRNRCNGSAASILFLQAICEKNSLKPDNHWAYSQQIIMLTEILVSLVVTLFDQRKGGIATASCIVLQSYVVQWLLVSATRYLQAGCSQL